MKWSVGTKITAAFAMVLIILIAIGAISFMSTRKLVETSRMVGQSHDGLGKMQQILSLLKDAETGQRGFLLTGEDRYLEPYTAALPAIDQAISDVRQIPDQGANADLLKSLVETKIAELGETIALRKGTAGDAGFNAALEVVKTDKGKQVMDEIRGLIGQMKADEMNLLDQRNREAEARASTSQATVIVGTILCILLVIALALALTRNISRPLRELTTAADRIAAGDLTVQFRADERGDEVGALTRTFGRMTASLQEMASVAAQIAAGDLRVSVKPQSQRDQLATAFVAMIANLRQVTAEISEGANVLGSSATEIVASTAQLASSSAQTAAAVTETTTTVEEVRQTAQVSSQKARVVAETSQKSLEISSGGKASTEETSQGMLRIREQMSSIAQSMVRLSEQTQAIGQIIATVDDLAQQSNLLAVNASIEAAKAGEQGRGFAVVAQEVRSLAEQSKGATNQVRTILSDIQKATNAAVMATEQGTKAVESGVNQAGKTGESILALGIRIEETASASAQIAASSQQQLIGMDQVAQAMESIKRASTQNVDSARQLETASRNLGTLGQRLKELVGTYKI
jgi:methyl-accepting chemotaxis protein